VNSDRDLVLELLRSGRLPAPFASSPLARELEGEVLGLDAETGFAALAFNPPVRFAQGAGVLQGGIIAALLDFAMAFAAHAKLAGGERGAEAKAQAAGGERAFSTASLDVHFLQPARPGPYIARGRIVRAGRRLLFAEARLSRHPGAAHDGWTTADELIATASAVLPVVER